MRVAQRARERIERDGAIALFAGALMAYAVTRLMWLDRLPISFIGDEAIHAVLGRRLFDAGLRGPDGSLLPVYFKNGEYWNLSLSVYLHGLTEWLFGASVQVARATNALVTVTGAAATGLLAHTALGIRRRWIAILALAVAPGWMLLSRSALEAPLAVSLYAWALLAYAHYRNGASRALPAAVAFAAAAAYAYSPAQVVVLVTAVLLVIADRRHHARNIDAVRWSLALALLLALPAIRFRLAHPDAAADQLRLLGSYMTSGMSLPEKLARLAERWGECLSPLYWYSPADELVRHRWGARGHLPLVLAPLLALGLLLAVTRARRDPGARMVLIALLAAPAGAALLDPPSGVTRLALAFVPAALLTALGADWTLERIRPLRARIAVSGALFVAGVLGAAGLLHEGLRNAPRWSSQYNLYGMQWGTRELFVGVIPDLLEREPGKIVVTPNWANNTTQFGPFFFGDRVALDRLELHDERYWTVQRYPIAPGQVAILSPAERAQLEASAIARVTELGVLRYPDGSRGFEILRVSPAQRTSARR